MRLVAAPSQRTNLFRRDFWFGTLDSRPLGVFRIAFAALLLKDALYRLPLAYDFYSDSGVVPRAALLELARADRFSLMDAMPHAWMAALFFILWAVVAALLLVGCRTRLMTVLSFIILMSVHDRNVYVLTGADTMMRVMSFWMLFVPLGQYYSVDAWLARRRGKPLPTTVDAFPVRMMQLQVALVYVFAGLLKLLGDTWREGDALAYVLQLDTMLLPPGVWFRGVAPDGLLRVLTYGTILVELSFVALVFAPVAQPPLRLLGLALGAALHLGIGILLSIPDFSLVMLISYLLFLEPEWIVAAERWLRRRLNRSLPASLPQAVGGNPDAMDSPQVHWTPSRRLLTVFLAVMMLGAIWWNVDYLGEYREPVAPMPGGVRSILWYSGLWQYWDLFAPLPLQVDGWITIPGVFEDGTTLDLRTGAPPNADMQRFVVGPLVRWEKFEENVYNNQYEPILLAWGQYYCRRYNEIEARPIGSRLATLEIHFRYRRSVPPGALPNNLDDDRLWTHWCYEEYAY